MWSMRRICNSKNTLKIKIFLKYRDIEIDLKNAQFQ